MPFEAPLFVYGTLRDPEICAGVIGHPLVPASVAPAIARGWQTIYYGDALYPALVRAAGFSTPGLLLSGLDRRSWERLDAFEGDDYRRGSVTVISGATQIDAIAYLPVHTIGTQPRDWTFETWTSQHRPKVIAQYRANGFSDD